MSVLRFSPLSRKDLGQPHKGEVFGELQAGLGVMLEGAPDVGELPSVLSLPAGMQRGGGGGSIWVSAAKSPHLHGPRRSLNLWDPSADTEAARAERCRRGSPMMQLPGEGGVPLLCWRTQGLCSASSGGIAVAGLPQAPVGALPAEQGPPERPRRCSFGGFLPLLARPSLIQALVCEPIELAGVRKSAAPRDLGKKPYFSQPGEAERRFARRCVWVSSKVEKRCTSYFCILLCVQKGCIHFFCPAAGRCWN